MKGNFCETKVGTNLHENKLSIKFIPPVVLS